MRLRFSVIDSGIGIKEEAQVEVFEPFKQAEPGVTRKFGGTGLGLTISRKLVGLMGGEIELKSRENLGSVFSFWIPLKLVNKPVQKQSNSEAQNVRLPVGLRVLVAEDNTINQKLVTAILSKSGCDVTVVSNGREAVDAIAGKQFDVVLMDIQMPVMDGVSALQEMRRQESGSGHIPVIALTAHALAGECEKFLALGFDGYAAKPYKREELLNCILKVQGAPCG